MCRHTKLPVAIVTGAAQGIGRCIAVTLAASKFSVVLVDQAENEVLEDVAEEIKTIGGQSCYFSCDLSNLQSHDTIVEKALEEFGGITCLINNAGVLDPMGPIASAADAQIVQHVLINQAAPAILISVFIRLTESLVAQRRIINISSGAARHPYAGWALYCASKAALY